MTVGVIIPAAGRGKRMGAPVNKPFLPLGGQPVLLHTLRVFDTHPQVDEIVVVSAARETERVKELLRNQGLSKVTQVIPGGAERQESVFRGLKVLSTEWVLVHDAVRPFVTHELIDSLLQAVRLHEAAILAVPLKDTVKIVGEAGVVEKTPDRRRLWAVQTPQAFRRTLLEDAHRRAAEVGLAGDGRRDAGGGTGGGGPGGSGGLCQHQIDDAGRPGHCRSDLDHEEKQP